MKARRPHLAILTLLAGVLAALVLAACGGGDSSGGTGGDPVSADTSAQDVLDSALGGGGDPIKSGVLDIKFNLDSSTGTAGAINAEIKGPFSSNGDGELPNLDFDVTAGAAVGGPTLNFDGGLTLTSDGLWVNYSGTDYQLDDQTFGQVKDSYAQSSQLQQDQQDTGSLSQFGIDPQTWLTNVQNEGTQDIDGTDTVHISGDADIKQITSDLTEVAQKSGQSQVPSGSLDQLQNSISNGKVDVYADTNDGSLRQLDVTLDVANGGGAGTSTITLSIGIADPNSSQDISSPSDAKPLTDLLSQLGGVTDSLGGLAPSTSGSSDSSGSSGSTGSADSGSSGGTDYYQCVSQAPTPDAVTDCNKLLN